MTREKEIYKVTLIGSAVNVLLLVFKFVAGFVAGSAAMIADAVHSLSDFITDVIVLVFVKISSLPQDKSHDYGHGKYETIATTMIGLALFVVAVFIFYGGAEKVVLWCRGEQIPAPGYLALIAAVVSILSKELVFRYTIKVGKKVDSQAVIANAWHHRSDALSSIGTAVGIGGAILLGNRWTILDPLASIIVSVFIVKVSWELMRGGLAELTESSLSDEVEKDILDTVSALQIVEPCNLRTRRIGNYYAIEMDIRMDGNLSLCQAHEKASLIESTLKEKYGPRTHVMLHMEPCDL